MMLIYANRNSTDALKIIELSGDRKTAPRKIASRKLPPYGFPLKHYHPENCPPPRILPPEDCLTEDCPTEDFPLQNWSPEYWPPTNSTWKITNWRILPGRLFRDDFSLKVRCCFFSNLVVSKTFAWFLEIWNISNKIIKRLLKITENVGNAFSKKVFYS